MHIEPTGTTTVKFASSNQRLDRIMRNRWTSFQSLNQCQNWKSAAWITDKKFSVNKLMTTNQIQLKEPI